MAGSQAVALGGREHKARAARTWPLKYGMVVLAPGRVPRGDYHDVF